MKRSVSVRAMSATLTVAALALANLAYAAPDALPSIPFERYSLDNGLTVILHHDDRLPLVAVSVWYDVGALHEVKGRSGFAHLFEHMMFQGSAHVGEDKHFAYLQQAGGTGMNGTTDFDRTNYFETVPRNYLELALWLESDRMGYLLGSLSQASLDNQIEVVKNERRQSIENAPYGLLEEKIVQTIWPASHPYHGNVIGSLEDLSSSTLDDVRDFFRTYYTPANATLTIAGDFDQAAIKELVAKYFATLRGRAKPAPVQYPAPTIAGRTVIEHEERVASLPKLQMVWMGPTSFAPDTAELDLLAYVLSGTKAARLDKRLVYDDQIAQSITAYFTEQKSGSRFVIDVVVRPGRTIAEAEAAVEEVLAAAQVNPPTDTELTRAKNAWETSTMRGLERLGGFSGRAERLQLYNNHFGDPGRVGWDLGRYRKATTADLKRVLDQYLGDNRLIVRATPISAKGGPR